MVANEGYKRILIVVLILWGVMSSVYSIQNYQSVGGANCFTPEYVGAIMDCPSYSRRMGRCTAAAIEAFDGARQCEENYNKSFVRIFHGALSLLKFMGLWMLSFTVPVVTIIILFVGVKILSWIKEGFKESREETK